MEKIYRLQIMYYYAGKGESFMLTRQMAQDSPTAIVEKINSESHHKNL